MPGTCCETQKIVNTKDCVWNVYSSSNQRRDETTKVIDVTGSGLAILCLIGFLLQHHSILEMFLVFFTVNAANMCDNNWNLGPLQTPLSVCAEPNTL